MKKNTTRDQRPPAAQTTLNDQNPAVPSPARGQIAAVEPAKRTRGHHTDKQNAQTHGDCLIRGVQPIHDQALLSGRPVIA
jgi:hypothetical protein